MPSTVISDIYRISKATVETVVPLSDVQTWNWEGTGPEGILVIGHTTSYLAGEPLPNWTTVRTRETRYPFQELRTQFLSSIPMVKFVHLQVTMDSTYIHFNLSEPETL
jgi:hypothetical protein